MTTAAPNHFAAARTTPNDEFYTQLVDVEKELAHYPGAFRGKTVYLPCDDPRDSAFWAYFEGRFHALCRVPGLIEALIPRKDERHGSTEEVPRRASGASDPDGGGSAEGPSN